MRHSVQSMVLAVSAPCIPMRRMGFHPHAHAPRCIPDCSTLARLSDAHAPLLICIADHPHILTLARTAIRRYYWTDDNDEQEASLVGVSGRVREFYGPPSFYDVECRLFSPPYFESALVVYKPHSY